MNKHLPLHRLAGVLLAVIGVVPTTFVRAQLPSGSGLSIVAGATANTANVVIADPGDHTWILQTSDNLTAWNNLETLKVHNGRFQRKATGTISPTGLFFRAIYDPARQTLTSTVANSLLLPATPANYANPVLPPGFLVQPILGQDNTPANNHVTNPAATLGRVLFYDNRLSLNQTVSCSSCHQQALGFTDGKRFSTGFAGGLTGRNSMGLSNARWYLRRAFFWDERAATLEDQVLQPIQNTTEMGMTLTGLVTRLGTEPYYATLFTNAFGSATVTSDRISKALAQFVRSIISTQSKYDANIPNFPTFTALETQGMQIFNGQGNCAACHGTDNFVPGPAINNNGLEFPFVDLGRGGITGLPQDNGLFKVPSLRNIELTAPYMHDGRFATLEQVVEFYDHQVVDNPNLSPPLRGPGGAPRRLNLNAQQKAALVAFLKTLTDTSVTTDVKFSDPFNYGDAAAQGAGFVQAQPTGSITNAKVAAAKTQGRR